MRTPLPCPERACWEQFLQGKFSDHERSELEEHLDDCASCRELLATLAEWPSAVGDQRDAPEGSSASWLNRLEACEPGGMQGRRTARLLADVVPPPDLPGFHDLKEVGRGGMGVVFHARQSDTDREVAIKVLSAAALLTVDARRRAEREAEALARLDHPNIVKIYDVLYSDDLPVLVMEWVGQGDLSERIAAGPLPPREAAEIARTLALAVEAAHAQGIIHRDIKPRNVLLANDGSPLLSDFGLARDMESTESLTASGIAVGTPGYVAPEQVESRLGPTGAASDVYALGATLYAMLTGRPPFQAASHAEGLRQILEQEPVSPRRLNSAIPPPLDTICRHCLEKRPQQRYRSAQALADDLERYFAGRRIRARRPGVVRILLRRARRHPIQAASVVAVVALLLALVAGSVFVAGAQSRLRADAEEQRRIAVQGEQAAAASADHANRLLGLLAKKVEASNKALHTLRSSPNAESQHVYKWFVKDATGILEDYFADRPVDAEWTDAEVQMLIDFAELRDVQGRPADAERVRRQCVEVGKPLLATKPQAADLRWRLVNVATWLAIIEADRGEMAEALEDAEQAYDMARALDVDDCTGSETLYAHAMAANNLGVYYTRLERFDDALAVYTEALQLARQVLARDPDNATTISIVAGYLVPLADFRAYTGSLREAEGCLDKATALVEKLESAGSPYPAQDAPALRSLIAEARERIAEAHAENGAP